MPKVLLIDDDSEIVTGASIRLKAAGYEVISVGDGEKGIAMASWMQPSAIVLDVQMPRMDGMRVLERLKSDDRTSRIPVVMLSGGLAEQTAALDAGAHFYLRKPYKPQSLIAAIEAAIESVKPTETLMNAGGGQ